MMPIVLLICLHALSLHTNAADQNLSATQIVEQQENEHDTLPPAENAIKPEEIAPNDNEPSQDKQELEEEDDDEEESDNDDGIVRQRKINRIHIIGNEHIPYEAIRHRIPYQEGEVFDTSKTPLLIKNVFTFGTLPYGVGYFKHVDVYTKNSGPDHIDIYVVVQEKHPLENVVLEGNRHLTLKEISKKIDFKDVTVIDEDDVNKYVSLIKKIYREKNYHQVDVSGHLETIDGKATMYITINEGKLAIVKRVFFKGNCSFSDKKLRNTIFTREDWVLSFLDKAGTYQPEAIESDKHTIEYFYQSNGFLNAKVINVDVHLDEVCHEYHITFEIEEGDLYTISCVHAPGNDIYTEDELLLRIPIRKGHLFSKEKIRESIEILRLLWGEHGYIFADIAPSIQPDDTTKTVDITFYSELESPVYLNRLNIIGNTKTRDRIIRRNITLHEGDLLTTKKMDESKGRVELLGYFNTRDGVNWRMHRTDKSLADLDLIVKEEKTGKIYGQLGFGGDPTDITSPADSLSFSAAITDSNLFGLGINFNLSGNLAREQKAFALNLTEPWLFDRPIQAGLDIVYKKSDYEDFKFVPDDIKETLRSGSLSLGFLSERLGNSSFLFRAGVDDLRYNKSPAAKKDLADFTGEDISEFNAVLNRQFIPGAYAWAIGLATQDVRNHPAHPSQGYQWSLTSRVGLPGTDANVGYFKVEVDFSWYTPLIGERDLVFCFHTHGAFTHVFPHRNIPYRELYHIGGPASVRGYHYGQIGPSFKNGFSLGGKNAFWINTELIFPINAAFTMKGAVFYDGGAGWHTPFSSQISPQNLTKNGFDYRQSIGFGVRLLQPTPIQLDWGFKLDRRPGESVSEAHLTMYRNF